MALYYVHTIPQADGDYEVHREDCHVLPDPANRKYLGDFASCRPAVEEAKKYYRQVDGCIHCARECHTS